MATAHRVQRNTGRRCQLLSYHGNDSALVRDEQGIAFYALLSDLEEQAEPTTSARPAAPKRFDRWQDADGQWWVFDQPRNPDGSYASNDPETAVIESKMRWYQCGGGRPVTAECRGLPPEGPG